MPRKSHKVKAMTPKQRIERALRLGEKADRALAALYRGDSSAAQTDWINGLRLLVSSLQGDLASALKAQPQANAAQRRITSATI